MNRRWMILAILLPIYTVTIAEVGWILCVMIGMSEEGNPFDIFEDWDALFGPFMDRDVAPWVFVPAGVLVLTQILFLFPLVGPPRVGHTHGRSLMASAVAAGFCGAMLTAGLLFALIEVYGFIAGLRDPMEKVIEPFDEAFFSIGGWWAPVAVSWLLWTPLLIYFARKQGDSRLLSRLVTYLFAGTVIEVLVVLPLDIMVRRKSQCYCGSGTAATLCFSTCALMWLTGPGVVIAVFSKRRRLWLETHCGNCGYAKGPSPGEKCPECGFEWQNAARAKPQAARPLNP
jgi:hypothetical protein